MKHQCQVDRFILHIRNIVTINYYKIAVMMAKSTICMILTSMLSNYIEQIASEERTKNKSEYKWFRDSGIS